MISKVVSTVNQYDLCNDVFVVLAELYREILDLCAFIPRFVSLETSTMFRTKYANPIVTHYQTG